MILDVGFDARVGFRHTAKFRLPVAVKNHPVDVAAARVRLPAVGLRGAEIDVRSRTGRVVRIEYRFDGTLPHFRSCDGSRNAFACHVRQLLVHELGRIGAALADEKAVKPLFGDALELIKEMGFWFFAGITPLRVRLTAA